MPQRKRVAVNLIFAQKSCKSSYSVSQTDRTNQGTTTMTEETSFCAYCYDETPLKLLRCGKCRKRQFCSKECQKQDWSKGHKIFCGKSGEIGVDYTIRDCAFGKGLFALRDFEKNEKIMVERPILRFASNVFSYPRSLAEVPSSAQEAVQALVGDSFHDILCRNGMSCTPPNEVGETGLFITMSRVNHSCLANADHLYLKNRDIKILVASRSIQAGEQITISYVPDEDADARKLRLRKVYKFTCCCTLCQDPDLEAKVAMAAQLDASILDLAAVGRIEQALLKGKALLALRDELQMSSWLYYRTFYDLFQVCITKKRFMKQGIQFIRKAYETVLAYCGDENLPEVRQMKEYMDSPSRHRNYLILG